MLQTTTRLSELLKENFYLKKEIAGDRKQLVDLNNDYVKLQDEHKKLTEEGFKRPITSTSGHKTSAKKKKLTT